MSNTFVHRVYAFEWNVVKFPVGVMVRRPYTFVNAQHVFERNVVNVPVDIMTKCPNTYVHVVYYRMRRPRRESRAVSLSISPL